MFVFSLHRIPSFPAGSTKRQTVRHCFFEKSKKLPWLPARGNIAKSCLLTLFFFFITQERKCSSSENCNVHELKKEINFLNYFSLLHCNKDKQIAACESTCRAEVGSILLFLAQI